LKQIRKVVVVSNNEKSYELWLNMNKNGIEYMFICITITFI
jgi:hypothetical protein